MKTRKAPRNNLDITILKQGTSSKKVLSVSFFTMADAYKNVEKYQHYLQKFLQQKKVLKEFETRIYTDDSGKEFALKVAKNDPTVSVYHFNYSPLREEVGHVGIFGMFPRFLPLFEPGLEVVWISDIDIPDLYLNPSFLISMKAQKAAFSYMNYACYDTRIYKRSYTIAAGTIISFKQFPKHLFTKFINQLCHPTKSLQEIIDVLNERLKKKGNPSSKIPYGIDEAFINTIVYNYLIKESISCLIRKDYEFAKTLLYDVRTKEDDDAIYMYYKHPTQQLFEKVKSMFKKKLPLVVNRHPCLQEFLSKIDTFKTSFMKTFVKTGKELDEKLYDTVEA